MRVRTREALIWAEKKERDGGEGRRYASLRLGLSTRLHRGSYIEGGEGRRYASLRLGLSTRLHISSYIEAQARAEIGIELRYDSYSQSDRA